MRVALQIARRGATRALAISRMSVSRVSVSRITESHIAVSRMTALAASLVAATFLVAACGGGGDPSGNTPTPSAPTGVRVTLVSLTGVRVDWNANASSEKVQTYSVLRNGSKLADVSTNSYTDEGLTALTTYHYTVVANGSGGVSSSPSTETSLSTFTFPDLTAPTVVSAVPAANATNVSISAPITITFSEPLSAASVTNSNIVLRATTAGTVINSTLLYTAGSSSVTLTPAAALQPSTGYTLSVTTGVKDASGNPLASSFSSAFTTGLPPDLTPPTVLSIQPVNGATDVATNATVLVTFSEPVNAATITATSIALTRTTGGTSVASTVTYNNATRVATVTPSAALSNSTGYTLTVSTAVRDTSGNALTSNVTSTFTTVAPVDVSPPTVLSVIPVDNAADVAINAPIVVTFSEALLASTVTNSSVTLSTTQGGTPINASVTYDAGLSRATLTPSAPLANLTGYTVSVATTVKDLAGNALASTFSSRFTTVAADVTPPTVTSFVPANGATNVDRTVAPTIVFSEPMNAATLTSANIQLRATASGTVVASFVEYNASTRTVTTTPNFPLAFGLSYTISINANVRDVNGVAIVPVTSSFTTQAAPPSVLSMTPASRASDVAPTQSIRVQFSEPMNPATVTSSTFFVRNRTLANGVAGTVTYDAATSSAVFTPANPFENYSNFSVSVTTGVTSATGRPLQEPFEGCFTPGPGTGSVVTLNGFWSADSACGEVHWHLRIVQSGSSLSLAPSCPAGDCQLSAINAGAGLQALGGDALATVTSLTGTVTGSAIAFTFTTSKGLTFSFTGSFASAPGQPNAWIVGRISGATLPAVGIAFENQRP